MKIYYKLYQLLKVMYKIVHDMKREYKYSLGETILGLIWECLDLCIEINELPDKDKKEKINKLSEYFDKLKLRLKMAQEVKIISIKRYGFIEENYMRELGNMIGGWKKWTLNNQEKV